MLSPAKLMMEMDAETEKSRIGEIEENILIEVDIYPKH
jgi:hypothetical protein